MAARRQAARTRLLKRMFPTIARARSRRNFRLDRAYRRSRANKAMALRRLARRQSYRTRRSRIIRANRQRALWRLRNRSRR